MTVFLLAMSALHLPEDFREVEPDRLDELIEGAGARVPVGSPADELGGVPQARALHVVVADLQHALGTQRGERQVLADVPPAVLGAARRPGALGELRGPVPRMALERRDQR